VRNEAGTLKVSSMHYRPKEGATMTASFQQLTSLKRRFQASRGPQPAMIA